MQRPEVIIASNYSLPELAFLMAHVGQAPVVVLSEDLPPGVNPKAIKPVLTRVYELEELRKADRGTWAGIDAVKDLFARALDWFALTKQMRAKTRNADPRTRLAAAVPSMCVWDEGRPFLGAVGADSGQVMTAIAADGSRTPLYLDLLQTETVGDFSDIAPWAGAGNQAAIASKLAASTPATIIERTHGKQNEFGTYECPICGKATEFKRASQPSRAAAHAQMMKHLKTVKDDAERHRVLYTRVKEGKAAARTEKPRVGAGA